MLNYLKSHPFAVEAFFERSTVLTYAFPKEQLQKLIPDCLSLDLFQDKWAFVAIAMVQTKKLRPKGFPAFMGNDFFLIGYRIFVRYKNNQGKRLRGLYILKSETDKKKMTLLGNIFTHYKYSHIDILNEKTENRKIVSSSKSGFSVQIDEAAQEVSLPKGSPFSNWKEARRFAGPLPFTFTFNQEKKQVLIIEGVRQNWIPKPLSIINHHFSFFENQGLENAVLANAFKIEKVPYFWKKGKKEEWTI